MLSVKSRTTSQIGVNEAWGERYARKFSEKPQKQLIFKLCKQFLGIGF